MMILINIDEALVTEAMRLTGARSKREVVARALRELVARASRPSVRELFGIGGVELGYDPKAGWQALRQPMNGTGADTAC